MNSHDRVPNGTAAGLIAVRAPALASEPLLQFGDLSNHWVLVRETYPPEPSRSPATPPIKALLLDKVPVAPLTLSSVNTAPRLPA